MKQDLERLMEERGLNALVVAGKMNGNPPMYYMANGAKIIGGYLIKKRNEEPVLLSSPIDREVAAASGLATATTARYDLEGILREKPDRLTAIVEFYCRAFADLDVRGEVHHSIKV